MKKKRMWGLMMVAVLFACAGVAGAIEKCMMCGMDAAKSETKFSAQVMEGNEKIAAGNYSFCCLGCMLKFMQKIEKGKIGDMQVLDFDNRTMFEASKGFYLVESEKIPQGSMTPFMLVFSDQETVDKYQKIYGGKIIGWDAIKDYVRAKKNIK